MLLSRSISSSSALALAVAVSVAMSSALVRVVLIWPSVQLHHLHHMANRRRPLQPYCNQETSRTWSKLAPKALQVFHRQSCSGRQSAVRFCSLQAMAGSSVCCGQRNKTWDRPTFQLSETPSKRGKPSLQTWNQAETNVGPWQRTSNCRVSPSHLVSPYIFQLPGQLDHLLESIMRLWNLIGANACNH